MQSQPETLQIASHPDGASPRQVEAVSAFARQWVDQGGGEIVIQSPAKPGDPAAAYRTAGDAREILVSRGVPPTKVRMAAYDAPGGAEVITMSYPRYKARGPDCGKSWGDLSATTENLPFGNLGCAVTANIAAQVANPADFLSPRDIDPPDAARRQTVLDAYRKGQPTSSSKDQQASGAVSTVIQ